MPLIGQRAQRGNAVAFGIDRDQQHPQVGALRGREFFFRGAQRVDDQRADGRAARIEHGDEHGVAAIHAQAMRAAILVGQRSIKLVDRGAGQREQRVGGEAGRARWRTSTSRESLMVWPPPVTQRNPIVDEV